MLQKMLISILFNVNNSYKIETSPQSDEKQIHI